MSPKQLPDVTNIGHNYPEVISDGLTDLARVINELDSGWIVGS